MKKQSVITIAAKWMLVAILVSLISVTTTSVIVNWHLQQVLQAFPILTQLGQGSIPQQDAVELEADETERERIEIDEEQASELNEEPAEDDGGRLEQLVNQWLEKDGRALPDDGSEDGSVPVWSMQQENVTVLSMDDLLQMRDELSEEDKMTIFSMAGTKIPLQDLQTLSELVENGLTMEEIAQIESMFVLHLSDQEVEQILQIAEGYLQ